ncbi:hypothetical protein WI664_19575 [Vibrio cholerae]
MANTFSLILGDRNSGHLDRSGHWKSGGRKRQQKQAHFTGAEAAHEKRESVSR